MKCPNNPSCLQHVAADALELGASARGAVHQHGAADAGFFVDGNPRQHIQLQTGEKKKIVILHSSPQQAGTPTTGGQAFETTGHKEKASRTSVVLPAPLEPMIASTRPLLQEPEMFLRQQGQWGQSV